MTQGLSAILLENLFLILIVGFWFYDLSKLSNKSFVIWTIIGVLTFGVVRYVSGLLLVSIPSMITNFETHKPLFFLLLSLGHVISVVLGFMSCWILARKFLQQCDVDGAKEHFWFGPVVTQNKAYVIIMWTGWSWVYLCGIVIFLGLARADLGQVFAYSIFLIAPIILMVKRNSTAAASVILVESIIVVAIFMFLIIGFVVNGPPDVLGFFLPVLIMSLALMLVSWRALKAASTLRKLSPSLVADMATTA